MIIKKSSLSVLLMLAVPVSFGQESYRAFQHLSGRVFQTDQQLEDKSRRPAPSQFRGWENADKFGKNYRTHFSRPQARKARADLLARANWSGQAKASTSQFSSSQLPGLQLNNSLPAGYIPTAVASGDFNGDGKMDFVVANGGDNNLWLYFGKGNGTFSLPIILPITLGQSPVWVTAADLRGTGKTDLVVAEADSNSLGIFLGKGDGTFKESSISLPGTVATLAIGDFNHDGKLDIAVPLNDYTLSTYVEVLPGVGNGTFGSPIVTPTTIYPPATFWVSSGDLNGDGIPDLVLSSADDFTINVQIVLNNGDGTLSAGGAFEGPFGGQFVSTAIFDGDEDGKNDLIIADTYGYLWFVHGNGDGTFAPLLNRFGTGDFPFGIGVADVNGDGHLDVVTSGFPLVQETGYGATAGDLTSVLLGDGRGNFGLATVYRGDVGAFSLAIADFNNDGRPDIVTANQDTDSAVIFMNDGKGGFGQPRGGWIGELAGPYNAPQSNLMSADVDGDGKPDIVLMEFPGADTYDQLTVLLNEGGGVFSGPIRSDAINGNGTFGYFGDFALADFRGTGLPDFLAIGSDGYVNGTPYISFAPNIGGGHFGPPTQLTPAGAQGVIGVGDFNGDGKLDFVAATGGATGQARVTIFLGNGDGTFRSGQSQSFNEGDFAAAVYVGDFNRDGKLDILVFFEANGGWAAVPVYELLGNGDGSFRTAQVLFSSFGPMVVADVNNDGHPDIIESAFFMGIPDGGLVPAQFSVYLGQPDGSFAFSENYAPYPFGSELPQYNYPTSAAEHYAPLVGDFNGDGNIDIAAFQSVDTYPESTSFVQFMLGNGDGTFTPSYTLYDFDKYGVPCLAIDVDGDGRDDLVELDGENSSFHVIPSIPGPSVQLALESDPVVGSTGSALVVLAVPSAGSTSISLSASDPAISVPASVTMPAGEASQAFTFTVGASFNANHVFAITASLNGQTATAYGTQVANGSRGFTVSAAPNPINLAAGQSTPTEGLVATSLNGYSGILTFQCLDLPSPLQCQMAPVQVPLLPGGSVGVQVIFSAAAGAAEGSYLFTLRATDGVSNYDQALTLNVGDFTITIDPSVQQALPTDTATFTLNLFSIDNYQGQVELACTGLPQGATCPSPFGGIPTPGGFPFPMQITTQSVAAGNYPFTVTGSSPPLSHSVNGTLQVWDFGGTVSPGSATISQGGSAAFAVSVGSINGFTGQVTLSCDGPAAVTCTFNPASGTVQADGTLSSTMTLTTSGASYTAGTRPLSILAVTFLALPFALLCATKHARRRTSLWALILMVGLMASCGGGSSPGGGGGGTQYTIKVTATYARTTRNIGTVVLTIKSS